MAYYDKVVFTPGPSFYKNNLFNAVAGKLKIIVFFTGAHTEERNEDFYRGKLNFEYIFLPSNKFKASVIICSFLIKNDYKQVIVSGWDNYASFLVGFISPRRKNACMVESTIYESKTKGMQFRVKKALMRRMSLIYTPGKPHERLIRALGFKKTVVCTGGCGLLNYREQPQYEPRKEIKKFLFVGRLTPVKNLVMLIDVFNEMPEYNLTIVGFGPQEEELKKRANKNIVFTGAVDNIKLPEYYQSADVFLLCSYSETWGLVVEEALNNGTPVIVSDHVGCNEDLVNSRTGVVFHSRDKKALIQAIQNITDVDFYNSLREGVSLLDFNKRAKQQVDSFINY